MKKHIHLFRLMILVLSSFVYANSLSASELSEKYWRQYDMIWEELPLQWNEGAFLGNGKVGMMVYADTLENSIVFHLSRPDVTDHKGASSRKTSLGLKGRDVMFDYCRLDIGKMKLRTKGSITGGSMNLDIYNATLSCTLNTTMGIIKFKAYTPYKYDSNIIEVSEGTSISQWDFEAGNPLSPRLQVFPNLLKKMKYNRNPNPSVALKENKGYCIQSLEAGGDYATYWENCPSGKKMTMMISIKNEVPESNKSLVKAKEEVKQIKTEGTTSIEKEMKEWWHNYYSKSYISIPDKQMESFYTIQNYKLATCSNPAGPAMDNFGTFFKMSQWPGMWWNLNVQLAYSFVFGANRLEQGENYITLIDNHFKEIIESIPDQKVGDYTWALFNYYLMLRYKATSWNDIRKKIMPKAEKLLAIYSRNIQTDNNGIMHLKDTESPEYEGFKTYDDSNYNLACLRWLLQTMMGINDITKYGYKEYPDWRTMLSALAPAPINENGFMIAANKPMTFSHRHFSHLLSIYTPVRDNDSENR